ncbi:unnamed protein product [Ceutorhynchus assimilis]|uniref:Ionotropic receptor n=1 Tax=Ceutorhynchus assimilis TaxID=467358 RepID=A0A9N9MR94_9CUCU|nr:unnamed protein product [Ceutorhynchus assimilis]
MYLSNILVIMGTFLTSSGKLLIKNESENLLEKYLGDIFPEFEATNYALTNFDLKRPSIPKILINFKVDIKIFMQYCPKIVLFDLRDPSQNSKTTLNYFGKINCGSSSKIVIITNQSNFQFNFFKDYVLYVFDEKLGQGKNYTKTNQIIKFSYFSVFPPETATIKIMYRDVLPFTDSETNNGLEETILRIIFKHLNLKYISSFTDELHPISKNATTGNYTNLPLLLLQHGLVDVVGGGFHPSVNDMYKDFQYSIVYFVDTLNLISPKAKIKPIGRRVLQMYSWELIVVSAMVFILLLFFIKYFYKTPSVFIIIFWFYQLLLDEAINNIEKKCSFRFLLSFVLMAYLISSTAFKNTLTQIYFSKEYEPEIHSYQDVIESGLTVYTRYLNATEDVEELAERLELCRDFGECLLRIAHKRDHLMFFQRIPVVYNTPRYFTNNDTGESLLHIGASFQQIPYQIYFRKNFPAFENINELLLRTFDTGILRAEARRLRSHYDYWIFSPAQKISSQVLNFTQLKFVFVIWLIGIILATLTLCVEVNF